jgi:hypothetical protein
MDFSALSKLQDNNAARVSCSCQRVHVETSVIDVRFSTPFAHSLRGSCYYFDIRQQDAAMFINRIGNAAFAVLN